MRAPRIPRQTAESNKKSGKKETKSSSMLRAVSGRDDSWDGWQRLTKLEEATKHCSQVDEVCLKYFQAQHAHPQKECTLDSIRRGSGVNLLNLSV